MTENKPCCAPQNTTELRNDFSVKENAQNNFESDSVSLQGGRFLMGTDNPLGYTEDGEGPQREIEVSSFAIDRFAVTNGKFATFIEETGYETEAELIGWSFVFGGLLPDDFEDTRGVQAAPWWRQVFEANWRSPEGPHSVIDDRLDHPVVHVSWNDAMAYAQWSGARLPTEAEWEFAAHGGNGFTYPWGDDLEPNGKHLMNVWQGSFPDQNLIDDGWYGTAPVGTYPGNGFGIGEMTGNVWEWCQDWFTTQHNNQRINPMGPENGETKVIKGGSSLCHASYCNRYRIAARSSTTPVSAMGHLGFRTVRDLE